MYFFAQDGFLFEIVFPNHPAIANLVYGITGILSPAFFLLFTRRLIIAKSMLNLWVKGHKYLVIFLFSVAFSVALALLFQNIKIAFLLVNFSILLSLIYFIPFIYSLILSKDIEVRYVALASFLLLSFTVLGILILQFNIRIGNFTPYEFMKIGVVLELMVFNLTIAFRIHKTEKEKLKTKENLIEQLRINQTIKDEMNAELESLVLIRTQELENQKAEIMAQRDDIFDKNILLEDKNHEILAQNETIERNHKQLSDSINYARIIQNAIIPPPDIIGKAFNDYFLLSQPKDIVSGDFYWLKHTHNQSVIVLADCTGHGVPGAMLSVLGVTGLNKIANSASDFTPANTLETLRKDVIKSLRQENDLIAKEGMDMAICLIDTHENTLIFSGAHLSGLIIRNGELIKLEASSQPLSRYLKETPFEQFTYKLNDNDMIYLFTDGYFDQLGGEYGKKFMSGKFKDTLKEIQNWSCEKQLNHLKSTLINWQGNFDQTDDITVLGIRYKKQ